VIEKDEYGYYAYCPELEGAQSQGDSLEEVMANIKEAVELYLETLSEVKGIGEQVELFRPYTIHKRIELFVPDERVEEISKVILEHARTGLAGDGLIAVFPIDYMIKVRTGEKLDGSRSNP